MYEYDRIALLTENDAGRYSRYFEFIKTLHKYQDNITISKCLQKKLIKDKLNSIDYKLLNSVMDGCVYHLNQTLKFNEENNTNLNHHYIIKHTFALVGWISLPKVISEKEFEKCNLFLK